MSPAGGHTEIYADPKPRDEDTFRILLCKGGVKQGAVNPPTIPYTDMGMDQAVYHPGRGTVFAVRGGYLFEFAAGSDSTLVQQRRFRPISFSDSSIAYDSVSGKFYVSCWNDPAGEFYDAEENAITNPYRVIYKVNPATLAVEATFDLWTTFGFGGNGVGIYTGPHQIVASAGVIYGTNYLEPSNVRGFLFSWNPTSNVSVDGSSVGLNSLGSWQDMVVDEMGGFIYTTETNNFNQIRPFNKVTLAYDNFIFPSCKLPNTLNAVGIARDPVSGRLYVTTRTNALVRVATPIVVSDTVPLSSIILPGVAPNPWRVRYNANDGLLYVPCYNEDTVVVVNPATDTVVATKTGFDLPFDICFTPTKKFVVQHGLVGLKELV